MVAARGKKKGASSNVTLEGNKGAENGLPESHSDSPNVDEPNDDTQLSEDEQERNEDNGEMSGEEVKVYHEQGRYAYDGEASGEEGDKKEHAQGMSTDYGEMCGEEGENVTGVYHEDLYMPGTGTNGDNKAKSGGNTFEHDEIGDQEEDEEEPFEHDNEARFHDEFEVREEETTEEDFVNDDEVSEDDAAEDDEVIVEKGQDKVSEEATKVKNDKDKAKVKQDGREAKILDIERSGASSKNIKLSNSNEKSRKKRVQASRLMKGDSEDKPESSRKAKAKKRVQSMGMIFMCTSETKKDCYQYKVLGLPEHKKSMVEKIYTGMRLFLYDIDLRLMYGIYKAAGPGGYNIEPKAFRSQYPSQVRFKVLENCLPLAEERFKTAIKENYFTKKKFHCLLNSEQVKKLCKLFAHARKGRPSKKVQGIRAEKQPIPREKNRRQISNDKKRLPPAREDVRRHERPRKRPRKGMSPVLPPRQRLPPPLPSTIPSSYVYDRVLDAYRLDPHVVERRSPYRDRRDLPRSPINPYRGAPDPPIERVERYRDVHDPPLDHRYAYVVPRDPYTDGVGSSYPRRRDPYRDEHAPYVESRDLYGERRNPYRDRRDSYVETRHSLRDGRMPYYGESARSELYTTYVRPPLSGSRDAYEDDRGIDFRDSYRRDELLGRQDPHPINSETRNNYISSRERPLYDETLYAAAYPSGAAVYRL